MKICNVDLPAWIPFLAVILAVLSGCRTEVPVVEIVNPYEQIDWENVYYLHSGSHLHSRSQDQWVEIYDMGIRHFALSNYYPSKPSWPLPYEFIQGREDIVVSPNAEHHSATDHNLHFTTIGSFYTTGYGRGFSTEFDVNWEKTPFEYTFEDLHTFDPEAQAPGEGVYRLDLRRDAVNVAAGDKIEVYLTIEGAERCDRNIFERIGDGHIKNEVYRGDGQDTIYFCVTSPEVDMRVEFDPKTTRIDRMRVMQGVNRPWQQAYREALDGNRRNESGVLIEGLQYPDGGGIVINHPRHPVEDTFEMLDFDERVLGVEVWNHRRWFGLENEEPHLSYYEHWNEVLGTGRRAFGFFVKDHRLQGRGRNILLVPDQTGRSIQQRERDALSAYRQGRFFGSLGAWDMIDGDNRVQQPYDYSEFYFTNIEVVRNNTGGPRAIRVDAGGQNEEKRPNIQFRFITDKGIDHIVDGQKEAVYELPVAIDGTVDCKYVRIEAFAYPDEHNDGESLTLPIMTEKNVYEIARIHDQQGNTGGNDVDQAGREPIGIVDMIFSQPIRFVQKP